MNTLFSVEPPLPPRPLTPAVRRRSWGQVGVRGWVLLTLVIFGIAAYLLTIQVMALRRDWWLVHQGVKVQAKIVAANGLAKAAKFPPAENARFKMEFSIGNGPPITVEGQLKDQGEALGPPMEIPLRVNPANPQEWTDRQQIALAHDLMLGASLLPLTLLLAIAALFRRHRALRVWKLGKAQPAVVVNVGSSALAPGGRVLRLVLRDARHKHPFITFGPAIADQLQPGDVIWVIIPPGTPRWAWLYQAEEMS